MVSGMEFSWKPAADCVPRELALAPIWFRISISDLDNGPEYTLIKFADDMKVGAVAHTPDNCVAIQRDLDGLQKYPDRSLMTINKGKC
ncbi:rna-directed dna polymerase from mobile element jockey-like [Pitangus sulphuratus]|nr:rna-directed dna polymerase from mobile element jockey-like [Pitangus sulphuratus]